MKKRISKHIENKDFVKVFITDQDDYDIDHFEGIIFDQSDKLILMCDLEDFNYDGLVILRKRDISEIKNSDNERFFKHILDNEKLTEFLLKKRDSFDFKLSNYKKMFENIQDKKRPLIIECKYRKDDRFIIGPIGEVLNKKVRVEYFNARGEYDIKPVSAKFKEITFIRVDSPYAEIFYKYSTRIK